MNSTFHSSGTASGNVEMMNRWKPIIRTTAATVSVWSRENSSTSGVTTSTSVPGPWASIRAPRRPDVVGKAAVVHPLDRLGRHPRRVGDHRRDHVAEVAADLGDRRAHPDRDDQQLRRDDHVDEREEREEDQRRDVLLRSRRDPRDLVAQAHQQVSSARSPRPAARPGSDPRWRRSHRQRSSPVCRTSRGTPPAR